MGYIVSALTTGDEVFMQQQVRNLNCGRFCLEALLQWRHGTPFGKVKIGNVIWKNRLNGGVDYYCKYGDKRAWHTPAVRAHMASPTAVGFAPENHTEDYGLEAVKPVSAAQWEADLRTHGPLIVGGKIGAVEAIPNGGHYVLVIGIDDQDRIVYLDPLGSIIKGGLAFFGLTQRNASKWLSMPRASFARKIDGDILAACVPL